MCRWIALVCCCVLLAVPTSHVVSAAAPVPPGDTTPTTIVESGAPVPGRPGPLVGPLRGTTQTGVRAAWWLLVLGGLQVVGLFVVTRRSRARLPVDDDAP